MLHTVNSFRMLVTCTDESTAFDLRHNISRNCTEQLARIIESVCSKLGADEPWVRIESIEVDLGTVHPDAFEMQFYNAFREKLEGELAGRQQDDLERRISADDQREELLEYFLVKGILPWWADGTVTDPVIIFSELLTGNEAAIYRLLDRHREDAGFWQRISLQFDDTVLAAIIRMFPSLQAADKFLRQKVYRKSTIEQLKSSIRQYIVSVAPAWFRVQGDDKAEQAVPLLNDFLHWYDEETTSGAQGLVVDMPQASGHTSGVLPVQGNLLTLPAIDRLMVKNAGIVLLAPFLEIFYNRLQLWDRSGWTNKAARNRAVHLLHYLATGNQQVPEHQLFFEKILCGMDTSDPLPRRSKLHNDEIREADILMTDVISHWKALKNSSVAALQQGFIRRDGMLTRQENDWLLTVERKTVDVLLESIPWGYTTTRLPWTNFVLYVEW